jgi:hypothetical protein
MMRVIFFVHFSEKVGKGGKMREEQAAARKEGGKRAGIGKCTGFVDCSERLCSILLPSASTLKIKDFMKKRHGSRIRLYY